jgi:hypothetical protein
MTVTASIWTNEIATQLALSGKRRMRKSIMIKAMLTEPQKVSFHKFSFHSFQNKLQNIRWSPFYFAESYAEKRFGRILRRAAFVLLQAGFRAERRAGRLVRWSLLPWCVFVRLVWFVYRKKQRCLRRVRSLGCFRSRVGYRL